MVGSSIDTKPCASPTLSLSLHPPASHIIQNAIGPLGKGPPTACFPVRGRHSYKLYSPMVVYLLILSENLKQFCEGKHVEIGGTKNVPTRSTRKIRLKTTSAPP